MWNTLSCINVLQMLLSGKVLTLEQLPNNVGRWLSLRLCYSFPGTLHVFLAPEESVCTIELSQVQ